MLNIKQGGIIKEYMGSYIVALLLVGGVLGILIFFGFITPESFLPNRCALQSGLICEKFVVEPTQLRLELKNQIGQDITLEKIEVDNCLPLELSISVKNGERALPQTLPCPGKTGLGLRGGRYHSDLNITYTIPASGKTEKNLGEISAKIKK